MGVSHDQSSEWQRLLRRRLTARHPALNHRSNHPFAKFRGGTETALVLNTLAKVEFQMIALEGGANVMGKDRDCRLRGFWSS
jgi:hypothetical protein